MVFHFTTANVKRSTNLPVTVKTGTNLEEQQVPNSIDHLAP